jgi:hypothetical protein
VGAAVPILKLVCWKTSFKGPASILLCEKEEVDKRNKIGKAASVFIIKDRD